MVGEIFVSILTVVFLVAVWGAAFVGPLLGGLLFHEWLHDERHYNSRGRVAQYSWLLRTAFWIAIVLYYALYFAILIAMLVPSGDVQ